MKVRLLAGCYFKLSPKTGSWSDRDPELGASLRPVRPSPGSPSEPGSHPPSVNGTAVAHQYCWDPVLPQQPSAQVCRIRSLAGRHLGTHRPLKGLLCKLRFRNHCSQQH